MANIIFDTKRGNTDAPHLVQTLKNSCLIEKIDDSLLLALSDSYMLGFTEKAKNSAIRITDAYKEIKLGHIDLETGKKYKTTVRIDRESKTAYHYVTKIECMDPEVGVIYARNSKKQPTQLCCFARSPERGLVFCDRVKKHNAKKAAR